MATNEDGRHLWIGPFVLSWLAGLLIVVMMPVAIAQDLSIGESFSHGCPGGQFEDVVVTADRVSATCTDVPPPPSGVPTLAASYHIGPPYMTVGIHPQPMAAVDWEGWPQIDDRVGQCFVPVVGGWLDHIRVTMGTDQDRTPTGTLFVRVYEAQGTPGVDCMPKGAVARTQTPTPGWIAESLPVQAAGSVTTTDFQFPAPILLNPATTYVFTVGWHVADIQNGQNTFYIRGSWDTGGAHPGNMANDGRGPNNGPTDQAGRSYDVDFAVWVLSP